MTALRSPTARGLAVLGEAFVSVCTLVLVLLVPTVTRPGEWPTAIAVMVALAGGGAATAAELLGGRAGRRADTREGAPDDGLVGTVTTLVRVGDEPLEVVRTAVLLAAQAGPCALVVGDGRELPDGLVLPGVAVYRGASVDEAIAVAAAAVDTDAVLMLSGRAVPVMATCRVAAGRLDDTHGWVVGTTRPFNRDRYAPDGRALVGARLRSRAPARGLDLWEPNATLVRTTLLQDHPLETDRPWGAWLRARRAEGRRGRRTADPLALVVAPAGATSFWPDAVATQRGAAADTADAIATGRVGARLLAVLLTVRELYAVALLAWLVLLFGVVDRGRFPFQLRSTWSIAVVAGVLGIRWLMLRLALGVPLHPVDDLRSAMAGLPGSLAAIPSVVRRRVRPPLRHLSTRPLVWAALFLTLLTGATIVGRDPSVPVPRLATAAAMLTLVALWLFTIRALVQQHWERASFRLPATLGVRVAGVPGTTVDCSPDGLGVVGTLGAVSAARGDEVTVEIDLDDGGRITTNAVLVGRRAHGAQELLGLSLQMGDDDRGPWAAQLLRAAIAVDPAVPVDPTEHTTAPGHPAIPPRAADAVTGEAARSTERTRTVRVLDRVVVGLVLVVSVVVLGILGLVALGFQPVVIRSASMTPAIGVGDVVISAAVPVTELAVGDVITRPGTGTRDSLTHRLQTITPAGDDVVLRTKGDANTTGETWTVPADSTVQRVQWTLPWVGTVVAQARTSPVRVALGALAVVLILVAVLRPRRHRTDGPPVADRPTARV